MPEGDTVWLTAKRLNEALGGHTVTSFDLRVPALATTSMLGTTVTEVLPRGKHILMRFDSGLTLHNHLRMDGSWFIVAAGRRPNRHPEHLIRALVGNDTWLAAGYRVHDLKFVRTEHEAELVGHLGPDTLGPDWDPAEAERRLRADPQRPIGEAILDQRNLAGVGNMYKSESLFLSRTNPWAPVDSIDVAVVVETAQRLLRANRDHPEQSTTGSLARGQQHWVYGRAGQPCRRCRTPVRVQMQGDPAGQRSTYWCPTCQPGADTTPR